MSDRNPIGRNESRDRRAALDELAAAVQRVNAQPGQPVTGKRPERPDPSWSVSAVACRVEVKPDHVVLSFKLASGVLRVRANHPMVQRLLEQLVSQARLREGGAA